MNNVFEFYRQSLWLRLAEWLGPSDVGTKPCQWATKVALLRRAGLRIGRNAIIMSGLKTIGGASCNVHIEDDCVIGPDVHLWVFHRLTIGKCTVIGAGVAIVNGGHDVETFVPTAGETRIGRGCWIGHGAKLARPLTLGDGAVVKPGAVVMDSVPAQSIVSGVPARVVGQTEVNEKVWLWGDRYFNPATFEAISFRY